jgi:hypothetical protein
VARRGEGERDEADRGGEVEGGDPVESEVRANGCETISRLLAKWQVM